MIPQDKISDMHHHSASRDLQR